MILSLFVGAVSGALYGISLQRTTALHETILSPKSKISGTNNEIRRALLFFSLRLVLVGVVFYFLVRFTTLNMSYVITGFIAVSALFLFKTAGIAVFHHLKKGHTQPTRRV